MTGLRDVEARLSRFGAVEPNEERQEFRTHSGTAWQLLTSLSAGQGFQPVLGEAPHAAMYGGYPVIAQREPDIEMLRRLEVILANQERRINELERQVEGLQGGADVPTAARSLRSSSLAAEEREYERTHQADLRKNHAGQWVAIHGGRVVAAGARMGEAVARAREVGIPSPYVVFVGEGSDDNGPLRV